MRKKAGLPPVSGIEAMNIITKPASSSKPPSSKSDNKVVFPGQTPSSSTPAKTSGSSSSVSQEDYEAYQAGAVDPTWTEKDTQGNLKPPGLDTSGGTYNPKAKSGEKYYTPPNEDGIPTGILSEEEQERARAKMDANEMANPNYYTTSTYDALGGSVGGMIIPGKRGSVPPIPNVVDVLSSKKDYGYNPSVANWNKATGDISNLINVVKTNTALNKEFIYDVYPDTKRRIKEDIKTIEDMPEETQVWIDMDDDEIEDPGEVMSRNEALNKYGSRFSSADLELIKSKPEKTMVGFDLDASGTVDDTEYFTKSDALTMKKDELSNLDIMLTDVISKRGDANLVGNLESTLGQLEQYRDAGYKLDFTSEGGYDITAPSNEEVADVLNIGELKEEDKGKPGFAAGFAVGGPIGGLVGYVADKLTGDKTKEKIMVAESMRSLGAETMGSIIQYDYVALTQGKEAAEGVRSAEKERLYGSLLDSSRRPGESLGDYSKRFWTSEKVIMDIYIPVATLGVSAGLSTVGGFIAKTPTGIKLISGGSKVVQGSKFLTVGSKIVGSTGGQALIIGGLYGATEGPKIMEVAQNNPESLGSYIGGSTYRYGMVTASMYAGGQPSQFTDDLSDRMLQGWSKTKTFIGEQFPSTKMLVGKVNQFTHKTTIEDIFHQAQSLTPLPGQQGIMINPSKQVFSTTPTIDVTDEISSKIIGIKNAKPMYSAYQGEKVGLGNIKSYVGKGGYKGVNIEGEFPKTNFDVVVVTSDTDVPMLVTMRNPFGRGNVDFIVSKDLSYSFGRATTTSLVKGKYIIPEAKPSMLGVGFDKTTTSRVNLISPKYETKTVVSDFYGYGGKVDWTASDKLLFAKSARGLKKLGLPTKDLENLQRGFTKINIVRKDTGELIPVTGTFTSESGYTGTVQIIKTKPSGFVKEREVGPGYSPFTVKSKTKEIYNINFPGVKEGKNWEQRFLTGDVDNINFVPSYKVKQTFVKQKFFTGEKSKFVSAPERKIPLYDKQTTTLEEASASKYGFTGTIGKQKPSDYLDDVVLRENGVVNVSKKLTGGEKIVITEASQDIKPFATATKVDVGITDIATGNKITVKNALNKTYVGSSLKPGSENISFIDTTLEGAAPITRTTTKTMSLTVVKPTPGELQLKTIQSLAGLNTALKNIKPKMDLLPRVTATSKANAIAATRVVAGGSFQNQIPLKWRGVYDVPRSSTVSNLNNIYTSTQGTTRLGNKYDLTLTPTSIFSTKLIQKQRIEDIGRTGDIYRTTGKQITGTETEERIGDIYGVGIKTELGTRMKVDELNRMGMGTITEQDMIQSQKQDDLLGMKQLQLQRTDLLYDSMRITVPITVPITIPIEPTIPKPPFIPMFGGDEGEPKKRKEKIIIDKGTGYDVYVKQRSMYHGKVRKPTYYKKVNKKPLDESSALALGGSIADDSSAITFKIKPTKGKGNKPQEIVKPWENIKHKFTKKGSVYIERTPYRIDTLGEQKDVSALGWRTNRIKGLKRDLLGNNNKLFEEKSKGGKRVKYF